jgi:hypothetical protein
MTDTAFRSFVSAIRAENCFPTCLSFADVRLHAVAFPVCLLSAAVGTDGCEGKNFIIANPRQSTG